MIRQFRRQSGRSSQPRTVLNVAAAVTFAAAGGAISPAYAQRSSQSMPPDYGRLTSAPVLAVVGIKDQRVSLYDGHGGVMRARISSGAGGYETPPGTFTILQKNKEHYSNLYDDAAMPFMQRLTWSGIALHEGVLPGYAASHGCVRLPGSFAEQIFPLTKIGMRVVIARDNVAPIEIDHPKLLKQSPLGSHAVLTRTAYDEESADDDASPRPFLADLSNWPARQAQLDELQKAAAQKSLDAEMRKAPVEGLKSDVAEATKLRSSAQKGLRSAEAAKRAADEKIADAEKALAYAQAPERLAPYEAAKSKADAAVLTATERLDKAQADIPPASNDRQRAKAENAARAAERALRQATQNAERAARDLEAAKLPARYKKQEEAVAKAKASAAGVTQKFAEATQRVQMAEAELKDANDELAKATSDMNAAVAAAADAKRKTLPVSLFISRKTQRLYLRQGHEPILDVPVTISEPDQPIGTHVYTAMDYKENQSDLRWSVVSLDRQPGREVAQLPNKKQRDDSADEPYPTDHVRAAAALDRVTIPAEIVERVSAAMWPGSSLIISDEALHKETSNATDFIVVMSGEPQGGLKHRPKPKPLPYYDDMWMTGGPNDRLVYDKYGRFAYDKYGRKVRIIQQKKPLFSWW